MKDKLAELTDIIEKSLPYLREHLNGLDNTIASKKEWCQKLEERSGTLQGEIDDLTAKAQILTWLESEQVSTDEIIHELGEQKFLSIAKNLLSELDQAWRSNHSKTHVWLSSWTRTPASIAGN